jgi:hypothetical protein
MADAIRCLECQCIIEDSFVHCGKCGVKLDQERTFITHYFGKGFEYEKIVAFLAKFHHIVISLRTLKSRLKSYGLSRKFCHVDEQLVR